jgi:hypothetical protein
MRRREENEGKHQHRSQQDPAFVQQLTHSNYDPPNGSVDATPFHSIPTLSKAY